MNSVHEFGGVFRRPGVCIVLRDGLAFWASGTEALVAACGEVRDARAWFQKAVGAVSDPSRYAATALFLGQCVG